MDFNLTKEQMMLLGSLKDMAKREKLEELAVQIETGEFPDHLVAKYADMGLLGMTLSSEYGGEEEPLLSAILAIEFLSQFSSVIAGPVVASNLGAAKVIDLFGTAAQRKVIIPAVCSGDGSISSGFAGLDSGNDFASLRTSAKLNGDHVLLNGTDTVIFFGGDAGHSLIYALFEGNEDQLGAIILEKETEGVAFEEVKLMGLNGIPAHKLIFENIMVPQEMVVKIKRSPEQIKDVLALAYCGYAAMCLGIGGGALDLARRHALQRVAFGRTISEFQAIRLMITTMSMKLDAARLLVYKAAENTKQGSPSFYEAAAAKCVAGEMAKDITDMALQIFGGYGYSTEYPVERMVRDSRAMNFLGGSPESLKTAAADMVFKGSVIKF